MLASNDYYMGRVSGFLKMEHKKRKPIFDFSRTFELLESVTESRKQLREHRKFSSETMGLIKYNKNIIVDQIHLLQSNLAKTRALIGLAHA